MKLQVNDCGAWRDVLRSVPADRLQEIMRAGTVLMQSLGDTRTKLRLLADDGAVYGYSDGFKHAWRLL